MKTLSIFLILALLGCEDGNEYETFIRYQLYIIPRCDPDRQNVERGIRRANALTEELIGQPMIDISNDQDDPHLTCHYQKPDWYQDAYGNAVVVGDAGYSGGQINMYMFHDLEYTDTYIVATVMHELVHFLGVRSHITDPVAVMHEDRSRSTTYTGSDKELFCKYFECKGE